MSPSPQTLHMLFAFLDCEAFKAETQFLFVQHLGQKIPDLGSGHNYHINMKQGQPLILERSKHRKGSMLKKRELELMGIINCGYALPCRVLLSLTGRSPEDIPSFALMFRSSLCLPDIIGQESLGLTAARQYPILITSTLQRRTEEEQMSLCGVSTTTC